MSTPVTLFTQWLDAAKREPGISEPTAMTLATVDAHGQPRARIVLLKGADETGFTFYTNHESAKGRELLAHPQAALLFYWMPLKRQVRIEGSVQAVSEQEADAYFATRERGSQIGAWASQQSQPLDAMATLTERVGKYEAQFKGIDVPRPPTWSGFRLHPARYEFWSEGAYRLHTRDIYTRDVNGEWALTHLYP